MKRFNKYPVGRGAVKAVIFSLALLFLSAIAVGAVASYKADHSTGIAKVQYEDVAGRATVIAVVALLIPAVTQTRVNNSVLGLQFTRTEETLLEWLKSGKADEATVRKYMGGQLRFVDKILYRSILIDGLSGIQRVWDSTIGKATGVTNVDRAKLDKDVHMCVDTILVGYVNSGGSGTDPSAVAGYDYVVTGWPAGLRNAELHVLQDNNPILENHPVQSCGSMADSTFGLGRAEGYLLKNPFVLEGDKNFEVRIDFPQAISATNTDFIRIDFYGVATRKRGMI